ncbi:MAG TPA: redoxin domain-containing protein [Gemmataceae bacterium]|nr:redoxin domain-containing protein [Gemmataceae bacterium]
MIELGELERTHEEFAKRHVQVVAVSIEGLDDSIKTQKDFPHLVVVSDAERKLISAVEALHPGAGKNHEDVAAPTTILVDNKGMVRWVYRPR